MSMSIEIQRVVQDLARVTIEQILHEAIMNSIHANANNIDININYKNLGKDFPCKVNGMTITDNGDGFTPKNTKSFETYKTTHKQNMGAKGVGRFLFLKLFNNISVSSLNTSIEFDINNVAVKTTNNNHKNTVISFKNATQDINLNLDLIEKNIKEHFLPFFHLMRKDSKVKINLVANDDKIFSINSKDIPHFKTDKFKLKKYNFTIDYVLKHYARPRNNGFYCADSRVVIKNNKDDKARLKSFKGVNILFLLSSDYLNKKVNDTRDDFLIHPKQKNSMLDDLSWIDIQDALSDKLKNILLDNGIDMEAEAKEELEKAINKAPYLSNYLSGNPYGMESDKLIADAEKSLNKDKEQLRNNKYNGEQEFQAKINTVTHTELAEYIFDRQKIIDNLKGIINKDTLEKEIHNLFMKKNTVDDQQDYKSNNLWLFDDRFMVYNKVFSDKQIEDIFPKLADNLDRPDILSVVSNTYDKDSITDIVIIELKKPDEKITPSGAEEQLLKYARYVNQSDCVNKIRIWTYAFLTFDSDTVSALEDKSYNKIPTQSEYSIYYRYHEARNIIINFMDYKALSDDANTRNQTFMKILNSGN